MRILEFLALICSAGMMILCSSAASGQDYPNKPIRIIASTPGGASDFVARLIAQGMTSNMRQQVIVENQGGASGIIAAQMVAKAPPDGYTLLSYGSPVWIEPLLVANVGYDPIKDFSPITLAVSSPNILVVHPSLPAPSVRDLISFAKARPGVLNYGTGASGGSPHLSGVLFASMAGIRIVQVAYRGVGPALTALISGEVELMFPSAGAAAPFLKSGRLRALAVTSAKPTNLAPGLPSVSESGLPGYESVSIFGMFAPARASAALISRLNQEVVRALNMPDTKQKLYNAGVEVVGSSPEQFAAAIKSDMTVIGKVLKEAGISPK